jgi:hypothetical protein
VGYYRGILREFLCGGVSENSFARPGSIPLVMKRKGRLQFLSDLETASVEAGR